MKQTFLQLLVILFAVIGFNFSTIAQTPCTTFNGGPYVQGDSIPGCDGTIVELFSLAAYENEVYFAIVEEGVNYTFFLEGCDPDAWTSPIAITAILGGTLNPDTDGYQGPLTGSITNGVVQGTSEACEITFTATASGKCYFVLSTTTTCGGANVAIDNGIPKITTNSGFACDECGNGTCAAGENYCTCADDCPCSSLITPAFIAWDPNGGASGNGGFVGTLDLTASKYCPIDLETYTGTVGESGSMYIGIGFFGAACLSNAIFNGAATQGTIVDFNQQATDQINAATVFFLQVTQADINASGGTTTITLTNPDDSNCFVETEINWSLLGATNNLVNTLCPPLNFECGANGCETGENYCNCSSDCSCADFVTPVYVFFDEQQQGWIGTPTQTADAINCDFELGTSDPDYIYLGVSFFGTSCLDGATFSVNTSDGELGQFDNSGSFSTISDLASSGIAFLHISQAEINAAAGGKTTVEFTNPDDPNCSVSLVISWSGFGTPAASLVADACPQGTCGTNGCEAGENYCSCDADCSCSDLLTPVFVFFDEQQQGWVGSPTQTVDALNCDFDLGVSDPDYVFVGISFFGALCLDGATFGVISTDGELGQFDGNGVFSTITELTSPSIAFLRINQAQINGSNGNKTTVEFTNPDDSNCSVSLEIDWSKFGPTAATLVAGACPQGTCGDNTCEGAENYCTCNDCDCSNVIFPGFITIDDQGNATIVDNETINSLVCDDTDPNIVYVNIAFIGSSAAQCVTGSSFGVSTTQGKILEFVDPDLVEVTEMVEGSGGYFLQVTQAEILASGGTTTVTFTDPNPPAGATCNLTLAIKWSDFGLSVANFVSEACIKPGIVTTTNNNFSIKQIVPMPASNNVQIDFTSPNNAAIKATIYDITGRTVFTTNKQATKGNNIINFNIGNYASGVYYVVLNNGANTTVGKIVKQ